jgi:hypothetical protein
MRINPLNAGDGATQANRQVCIKFSGKRMMRRGWGLDCDDTNGCDSR